MKVVNAALHHADLLFEHGGLGAILAQSALQLEQLLPALVLIVLPPLHLLLVVRDYLLGVGVFGLFSSELALEIVYRLLHLFLDLGDLPCLKPHQCASFVSLENQTRIFRLSLL